MHFQIVVVPCFVVHNLKVHIEATHKNMNNACDQCDYKTGNNHNLKVHIESVHEAKAYSCNECGYKSNEEGALKTHIDTTHVIQVSTQEFIEDSRTRRKLKQSGKEDKVKCDQCEWKTGSITLLNKHKTTIHDKDQANKNLKSNYTSKRIKCDKCDKKFNKNETYRKHTASIHNETEEYSNQTKPNQVMTFLRSHRSSKTETRI